MFVQCAEYLKNEVIPNFVKSLTEKYPDSKVNDFRFLTPNRLVLELHQEGINIRHLGHVKAVPSNNSTQKITQIEITEISLNILKFCFLIFFCNYKICLVVLVVLRITYQ